MFWGLLTHLKEMLHTFRGIFLTHFEGVLHRCDELIWTQNFLKIGAEMIFPRSNECFDELYAKCCNKWIAVHNLVIKWCTLLHASHRKNDDKMKANLICVFLNLFPFSELNLQCFSFYLLALPGALLVMMCSHWFSAASTFSDFHSAHSTVDRP